MTGSWRGMLLLLLLVLLAAALGFAAGWWVGDEDVDELTVVRGTVGSEKIGLLANPAVRNILAERYDLRVEATAAGSLAIMAADPEGQDFLWPGSPIVDETRFDPAPTSAELFYSPIVLFSWAPVTDALVAAELVQQVDGTFYVTDFPRLVQLIDQGAAWAELGLPQIPGSVAITTTDPTTSNSGSSFAGLLANTYNGGAVVVDATAGVLAPIQAYYDRLGDLEQSSGFLFEAFVSEGMASYPLVAGYESSLIEFLLESEESLDPIQAEIRNEIRLLYPQPTVWSSHPLIALTPAGEEVLAALHDEEIQQIAWERHGFRTGFVGVANDPAALGLVGVPQTIDSVMPLPRASAMDRIVASLRAGTADPPATPVARRRTGRSTSRDSRSIRHCRPPRSGRCRSGRG